MGERGRDVVGAKGGLSVRTESGNFGFLPQCPVLFCLPLFSLSEVEVAFRKQV